MTAETPEVETITIDNVNYKLTDLTGQQQYLISIFKGWKDAEAAQKQKVELEQVELYKLQAALRAIGQEISTSVKATQAASNDSNKDSQSSQNAGA